MSSVQLQPEPVAEPRGARSPAPRSRSAGRRRGMAPRAMFSATERWPVQAEFLLHHGDAEALRASEGVRLLRLSPPTSMVPPSGTSAPDRRLIRVDLPAPFSPSSAWIRPAARAMETSSRTGLPKKAFRLRPRSVRHHIGRRHESPTPLTGSRRSVRRTASRRTANRCSRRPGSPCPRQILVEVVSLMIGSGTSMKAGMSSPCSALTAA